MARFTSTVSRARSGTASLRTTVPIAIAKMLDLQNGDALNWDVEVKMDKVLITVSKQVESL